MTGDEQRSLIEQQTARLQSLVDELERTTESMSVSAAAEEDERFTMLLSGRSRLIASCDAIAKSLLAMGDPELLPASARAALLALSVRVRSLQVLGEEIVERAEIRRAEIGRRVATQRSGRRAMAAYGARISTPVLQNGEA